MDRVIVLGFLMALGLGIMIGFIFGQLNAFNICVDNGIKILELHGIGVNVNKALIISAIQSHRGAVGGWLNISNAYSNSS